MWYDYSYSYQFTTEVLNILVLFTYYKLNKTNKKKSCAGVRRINCNSHVNLLKPYSNTGNHLFTNEFVKPIGHSTSISIKYTNKF
jgi:hypothetical protein